MLSGEQHAEAGDMEQRQHAQIDVVGRQRPVMQKLRARRHQIAVREQCAARPSADRGGVDHDKAGVGIGVRRWQGAAASAGAQVHIRREWTGGTADPVPALDHRQVGLCRL